MEYFAHSGFLHLFSRLYELSFHKILETAFANLSQLWWARQWNKIGFELMVHQASGPRIDSKDGCGL
jgi:hypothetical protein